MPIGVSVEEEKRTIPERLANETIRSDARALTCGRVEPVRAQASSGLIAVRLAVHAVKSAPSFIGYWEE